MQSLMRNIRTLSILIGGLFCLLLPVQSQTIPDITRDPMLQNNVINASNWQPGGRYFQFNNSRGAVDPATVQNTLHLQGLASVRMGSFSIQNAYITGGISYNMTFNNHPHWVHAPFDEKNTYTASDKSNFEDGSQVGYSMQWTGMMVHPADGYDGSQGGGYPAPAGGYDQYSFNIQKDKGLAVATYFVPAWSMAERPGRLEGAAQAWNKHREDGTQKILDAWGRPSTSDGFWGRTRDELDRYLTIANGSADRWLWAAAGGVGGFLQPDAVGHWLDDNRYVKPLQQKSVEDQFAQINKLGEWQDVKSSIGDAVETIQSIPVIGSGLEFAGNAAVVVGAGSVVNNLIPNNVPGRGGIPNANVSDLSPNAQNIYQQYSGADWKGNISGQTAGTNAGGKYMNTNNNLPSKDAKGNNITYKEFDVNNKQPGQGRDAERFVKGSDGSVYHTNDHYENFRRIE